MDFSTLPHLFPRQDNTTDTSSDRFDNCTDLTPFCPVDATIYGYAPNLAANVIFVVIFGICLIAQTAISLKYRTWTYLIALFFGCLGETIGYVGRILLNDNPWSEIGFQIQICCLIIAPAFFAAGVYITLKHIVIELSPTYSHLPPRWYTWIFILCDFLSLVLQGAGGGTAATADNGSNLQDIGNDLMMAGIVWQVITLLVFGGLCLSYGLRVRAHRHELSASATRLLHATKFRMFLLGIFGAYLTIFTRCVYRIAEMSHGWKSAIMQDETGFIVLEGVMVAIAVILLTVFHPAISFPEMQAHKVKGWSGRTEQEEKFSDVEASSRE